MTRQIGREELTKILSDWSYWDSPAPPSIPRDALTLLERWPQDLPCVVQGIRRCGKSTFLTQIAGALGVLGSRRGVFCNFEDPRLSDILNVSLLDAIVEDADTDSSAEPTYFFFDEIQNITAWERWINFHVERPRGHRFAVTGSNAALLGGRLGSTLTGRHWSLEMFPFSWPEFQVSRPGASLDEYFSLGGFPRALSVPDPASLLREYFSDIIERDVRRHVAARSVTDLQQVCKALFEASGSETSFRSLAKDFGTSTDTVGAYVRALEASYLVMSCPYFSYSERQRAVRPAKYYSIDSALARAVTTRSAPDLGKKLEGAVFLEMKRRFSRVSYWRGQREVDFVVEDAEGVFPVQVTWSPEPKPRHHEGLAEFKQEFPQAAAGLHLTRSKAEDFLAGGALSQ